MRLCFEILVLGTPPHELIRLERLFYQDNKCNSNISSESKLSGQKKLIYDFKFNFSISSSKIFWQSFNRIVAKLKENENTTQKENIQVDSDLIYFKSEAKKHDNISHFVLLLTNDVLNSVQFYYVICPEYLPKSNKI